MERYQVLYKHTQINKIQRVSRHVQALRGMINLGWSCGGCVARIASADLIEYTNLRETRTFLFIIIIFSLFFFFKQGCSV